MRLERDELKEQMVGLRREIEHQKNRVIAYERQIKDLQASEKCWIENAKALQAECNKHEPERKRLKELMEQIEKLKEGTIKPDMFHAALCQKCSCDGDLYHATINLHPVGTTFRCPQCVALFTPSPQ
jgi:hypothetical protein